MKKHGWNGTAAVLVAALVGATLPAAPARAEADDNATGTAIAAGLMVAVVVVYALVTLRSDVERYSQNPADDALARAARAAESSPVFLKTIAAPLRATAPGLDEPAEVAGAAIGLRLNF